MTSSEDGRARPTIRDVAKAAGVSKSLVSLVLQGSPSVSERRREAVLEAMAELGYRPNLNARNLVQMRSRTVGVVVSDMLNPWCADFLEGFDTAMRSAGYNVLLGNGRLNGDVQISLVETFLEYDMAGICLGGTFAFPDKVNQLLPLAHTVVVHNLELIGPHVDVVSADYKRGARDAVEHLLRAGHTRIAHIAGVGGVADERRAGYTQAMAAARLPEIIVQTDFSEPENAQASHQVLTMDERPTAVFAVNDLVGISVINTANALGRSVPSDLAVIGCDNTTFSSLPQVSMSSVDNHNIELGHRAAALLLARIAQPLRDPEEVRLDPELVVRSSSAVPLRRSASR